jgi:hypothetical protein
MPEAVYRTGNTRASATSAAVTIAIVAPIFFDRHPRLHRQRVDVEGLRAWVPPTPRRPLPPPPACQPAPGQLGAT